MARACRASFRAASSSAWRWRRSLVLQPSVMLFDEPLSNLDARLRRSMREEIRQLQQRLGLTVAYVTHDQSEALAVSDQIIVMDAGLIAQAGTPQQLYEHPKSEFVAGFMGEAMLFDGVALADGTVQLGPLRVRPRLPVAAGAVKVAVRPEAWRLVGSANVSATDADGGQTAGHGQQVRLPRQLPGGDAGHSAGFDLRRLA